MRKQPLRQNRWFIAGVSFIAGVVACLIGQVVLSPESWRPRTVTGPVGIISAGAGDRGYLGAVFSNEPARSLIVAEVTRPATDDANRLTIGDRVTSVDGRTIASFDELEPMLAAAKPGQVVELVVLREERPVTLRIRLVSFDELHP